MIVGPNPKPTVGVRAVWNCATCPATHTGYQIARVAPGRKGEANVTVEPPRGWLVSPHGLFCPNCH